MNTSHLDGSSIWNQLTQRQDLSSLFTHQKLTKLNKSYFFR